MILRYTHPKKGANPKSKIQTPKKAAECQGLQAQILSLKYKHQKKTAECQGNITLALPGLILSIFQAGIW
jgi:hypothetical protein